MEKNSSYLIILYNHVFHDTIDRNFSTSKCWIYYIIINYNNYIITRFLSLEISYKQLQLYSSTSATVLLQFVMKKRRKQLFFCSAESRSPFTVFMRDAKITPVQTLARNVKSRRYVRLKQKRVTQRIYSLTLLMASRHISYSSRVFHCVFRKFQVALAKVTSHMGKNSATLKCSALFHAARRGAS